MERRGWFGVVIGFKQGDVEDKVDFGGGWEEEFIGNLADATIYGVRTVEFLGELFLTLGEKRCLTISLAARRTQLSTSKVWWQQDLFVVSVIRYCVFTRIAFN